MRMTKHRAESNPKVLLSVGKQIPWIISPELSLDRGWEVLRYGCPLIRTKTVSPKDVERSRRRFSSPQRPVQTNQVSHESAHIRGLGTHQFGPAWIDPCASLPSWAVSGHTASRHKAPVASPRPIPGPPLSVWGPQSGSH